MTSATIFSLPALLAIGAGLLIARLLTNRYAKGLNRVPGPVLASFTDLWRVFTVWGWRAEVTHIALHQKYGKVVRIGPEAVSVSDPKYIQVIYAVNAGFNKTDFYPVQMTLNKQGIGLPALFNSLDPKFHAKLRRAVANAYAMSTLIQFEPFVDSTTTVFLQELEKRFADRSGPDGVCDFGTWLQYYAFDVIGELTFSKRLGFIEQGKDVQGIIGNLEWFLNYAAIVGQVPKWDRWLLKNPFRLWLSNHGLISSVSPVALFARERMTSRIDVEKEGSAKTPPSTPSTTTETEHRRDFLSRFIEAHQKDPEFFTLERVHGVTTGNMLAGSDTTAITLRAIFYYLMRHPDDMKKLVEELEQEEKKGNFSGSDGLVTWNEAKTLPFLDAVIKEALRCHPAIGLTLERRVPPGGVEIEGQFIPGDTIIGINPWVAHQDSATFGPDAAKWRPSRWIEASEEERKIMDASLFSFGAGSRTCIGKNISLLEMYKVVPAVLRRFDLEFVDPSKEWNLHNAWFLRQRDFYIRLKKKTISESNRSPS